MNDVRTPLGVLFSLGIGGKSMSEILQDNGYDIEVTLQNVCNAFNNILEAFANIGIDCSNLTADSYGQTIKNIGTQLDELESKISEDNTNFNDIYNAILNKGQEPTEDDRSTYADAINNITTGSGDDDNDDDSDSGEINIHYSSDRGGDSIFISSPRNYSMFDTETTNKIKSVTVELTYTDSLENTVASLSIDEMSSTHYTGVISGNTVTFSDLDFSDTNSGYEMTFENGDGTNVSSTVYSDNKLLRAKYTVTLSDGGTAEFIDGKKESNTGLFSVSISDNTDGKITTLAKRFMNWNSIKAITLTGNFSNVTSVYEMFQKFNNKAVDGMLVDLDLSGVNFDSDKLVDMGSFCWNSKNLKTVKMNENFTACGDVSYAFEGCASLETVDIDLDPSCIDGLFAGCSLLKSAKINMEDTEFWEDQPFADCSSLVSIVTSGALCSDKSVKTLTLDLSASDVFKGSEFLNSLGSNNSGQTRIIKFSKVVYDALTENDKSVAGTKNYTLTSGEE